MFLTKTDKKTVKRPFIMAGAFLAFAFLLISHFTNFSPFTFVFAAPDQELTYHGKLTDMDNVSVEDNSYDFTLIIWDDPTSTDTSHCLWTARGTCGTPTAKSVTVTKGIFTTILGGSGDNALNVPFDGNYYLGVTIGTNSEMTPRRKITSTGFALNAQRLNGLESAETGANAHIVATNSTGNLTVTGNILPQTDDDYTLGDTTHRWQDLFLGPNSLHIGTNGDEGTLSYDTTNNIFNFNTAAVFGTTVNSVAGTIRYTGTDFEGYNGSSWLSLTSGGTGSSTFLGLTDTPSAYTAGSILFTSSSAVTEDNTNLFWDDTNNRLGLGDTTPDHALDVAGNIGLNTGSYINFGDTDGITGYGIRENSGVIEYKNSGGSWTGLSSGGGSAYYNHTFTTSETWTALSGLTSTATYRVTMDARNMAGGQLSVTVDGNPLNNILAGTSGYYDVVASQSVAVVSGGSYWDVSTASYASKSFSVNAQDTSPFKLAFSADGTKMYVLGLSNKTVYQYTLSTAWDVSTASYASKSFSTTAQDTSANDLSFSADGAKMYVLGYTNKTVYQYNVGTAFGGTGYASVVLNPGGTGSSTFLGLTDTPSAYTANRIMYTNAGATALTDSSNFTYDGNHLAIGGSIKLGTDANTCDGTKEGAMRYNSTSKVMEFCNGTAWGMLGSGGYISQPSLLEASWITETGTLPGALRFSQVAVIGDYVYLFGGYGTTATNIIYRAPTSDPTAWVNTGSTLPTNLYASQVAVIGDYVYLFGGNNGTVSNVIYRAPVSNPTSWTNTGSTLPGALIYSSLAVIGDYVYLFGGQNASVVVNVIYRAPVSNPTSWTNTGSTLPAVRDRSQIAVIGDYVYLFGGYSAGATNLIYRAPVSDPTAWVNTGSTLRASLYDSQLAVIGDYIYLFGGTDGTNSFDVMWRAPVSNPTNWADTNANLPVALYQSQSAVIGDRAYLFGGYTPVSSAIYSAEIKIDYPSLAQNPSWKTRYSTNGSNSTTSLSSLWDLDSDTGIQVEESADEDIIRFDTGGTERMTLNSIGYLGLGTATPSSLLDLQQNGTVKANTDMLELTNSGNATDMDATTSSILFNQYYYDATTPAVADSARITVGTEQDWTSTATTQDSYMSFNTALDGALSEKMRISSDGKVGIGTVFPSGNLSVVRSGGIAPSSIYHSGSIASFDAAAAEIAFGVDSASPWATWIQARQITNIAWQLTLNPAGGNVGINTNNPGYPLTVNGQPAANGYTQFTNYSDSRLKENKELLPDGYLDKIMQLKPTSFNYNKLSGYDEETRSRTINGFIAQELQEVFPDMIGHTTINGTDYLDTNLSSLPIFLTKAIQEQQHLIEINTNDLTTKATATSLADLQNMTDDQFTTVSGLLRSTRNDDETLRDDVLVMQKDASALSNDLAEIQSNFVIAQDWIDMLSKLDPKDVLRLADMLAIDPNKIVTATEEGDVTIKGIMTATKIIADEVETKKLMIDATTQKDATSAGVAVLCRKDFAINDGKCEEVTDNKDDASDGLHVFVPTTLVTKDSRVMITPHTPIAIGVTNVDDEKGFEVSVDATQGEDIEFDWFVVDTK